MINGFGIIVEDDILFCSNENRYTAFEIILFVEKLISSLNPKQTWRLNNIYLKGYRMGKERMIIKHRVSKNKENIFLCIGGDFLANSKVAREMLEEFCRKVNAYYKTTESIIIAGKKPIFKEIIEVITDHLWDKYEDLLEEEEEETIIAEENDVLNNVLYCGISAQGLPIISQLYSKIFFENLGKDVTEENVEIFSSDLSAKLATIAMNTIIRAKTSIREIVIDDIENPKEKKIVLYGDMKSYSLDFLASGNLMKVKEVFKKLKNFLSNEEILQDEFAGDLKPYKHLHETINKFYEEGL